MNRALRPDAQAFDEVRIVTVPRYKTSGLSGDEWRISAKIMLMRKGQVVHESSVRNAETAVMLLGAAWLSAIDDGKAFFAGIGDFCDQEGCAEKATVTYRVKKEFSSDYPHEFSRPVSGVYRRFCARHAKRGNCGFDDTDSNYELIEGEPKPMAEDESPAGFGGVVDLTGS